MHVVHIVRDLDVASGGPSRSVPALAESQSRYEGVKVTVFYQNRGNPVVPQRGADVNYKEFSGNGSSSKKFVNSFSELGSETNGERLFHLHGLWSP
ncbi:hypothetical protein ACFL1V_02540, partial [Pseudomonadota bacterium]